MEIVFAGFGGQGVLTSGLIVAYTALKEDNRVMWSPAYGGAMRGGKAFSVVKYSKEKITAPAITRPDVVVAMNKPSLDFAVQLKDDGILIVNSDVVEEDAEIKFKGKVLRVPINRLAIEATGRGQASNVVSVGVIMKQTGAFDKDTAIKNMKLFFEEKGKGKYNDDNEKAFLAGYNYEF